MAYIVTTQTNRVVTHQALLPEHEEHINEVISQGENIEYIEEYLREHKYTIVNELVLDKYDGQVINNKFGDIEKTAVKLKDLAKYKIFNLGNEDI